MILSSHKILKKKSDNQGAMKSFRTYLHYFASVSFTFRPRKRLSLIRNYIHLLLASVRRSTYTPPTPPPFSPPSTSSSIYSPVTIEEELLLLYGIQAELVKMVAHFPRAEEENKYVQGVYEGLMIGSGVFGRLEREEEDFEMLKEAIQNVMPL